MRPLRKLPEVPGGAGHSLRKEKREAPEHPEGMPQARTDLPGNGAVRKNTYMGHGQ